MDTISFDTSVAVSDTSSTSPKTWSHTNSGNLLVVGIGYNKSNNAATVTSSATYNGVAMTKLSQDIDTGGFGSIDYFYLVGAATGAHNVSVTFSPSTGTISASKAVSASYFLVRSDGQPDSSNHASNVSGATVTMSTTVVNSNCWLIGVLWDGAGSTSVGAGTTFRVSKSEVSLYDSGVAVSTGSQSLISTGNGGSSGAWIIMSVQSTPKASVADTVSTSDSIASGIGAPKSDTMSMSDSVIAKIGFATISKSTSVWTKVQKS